MSHSITQTGPDLLAFAKLTIINYVVGGETVLPSEIAGSSAIDGVVFGTVPSSQNSLGVPLFPVLSSGKVMLFRFVSGIPTEIPATTGLNAVIPSLIHIGG